MDDKPLFILLGNGSLLNRGCDAIMRGTIDIVRRAFGESRFINTPFMWRDVDTYHEPDPSVSHLPRWLPDRGSLPWFVRHARRIVGWPVPEVFERHVPASAATLALGGDTFSLDYIRPDWRFWTLRRVMARGKPAVIWGASVGPFSQDADYERFAAGELKNVSLICARETATVEYLDSLGVRDNVLWVADPAFVMQPAPAQLSESEQPIVEQPHFGLNFSPLMAEFWSQDRPWLEQAADCVRAVLDAIDLPVALVPHVTEPGNDDHAFLKQLRDKVATDTGRLTLIDRHHGCRESKWIISQLHGFAGARTHATIAAMSSGVPTISIGYSVKARGINRDLFGHTDWLVPLNELEPQRFAERCRDLLARRQEVTADLQQRLPAYQDKAWAAGEHLKEVIGR